jgi:Fur family ferric uptake transcriptional regulator
MIVSALRHSEGHLTATKIVDRVRDDYPMVDVSTVYRTLDVLKRMRLATETDMGSGDAEYEWAPEQPHHHLICSSCGQIIELGHSYFEELSARLEDDLSFSPDLHHFAIFGLCKGCRLVGAGS